MSSLPPWLADGFGLYEGEEAFPATRLAGLAQALAPRLDPRGLVVVPGSVLAVLVAILAAQSVDIPLVLARSGSEPAMLGPQVLDAGLQLGAGSGPVLAPGFSLTLLTSGTTGVPKQVRHRFEALAGRVARGAPERWLLSYEPGAFAGMQVLLSAAASGGGLVAAAGAGVAGLADAAVRHEVTAISGTPTFWRALLIALGERSLPLRLATLGGETAEQALLDRISGRFPGVRLRHIYASTEAGAVFSVADGRQGFPSAWLEDGVDGVRLRIVEGGLQVESPRAATGGWIDTGDIVERDGDRVRFVGRRDSVVNVGGVKVILDEVERLLAEEPGVADICVRAKPNPITGFLLTAELVADGSIADEALLAGIRARAERLPPAARPRLVRLVPQIETRAGKKPRAIV